MASERQTKKPLKEMSMNQKVDPSSKLINVNLTPSKDGSTSNKTSCISSSGNASGTAKETYADHEYLMAEQVSYYPTGSYYGCYYPGYDGYVGALDDHGYLLGSDGLEIQYPGIQADNGSLIYYMPGIQPGHMPYNPYLPGATVGIDGQYVAHQPYFPSPISPQPIASPGYFPPSLPYGSEAVPSYLWDPSLVVGDEAYGNVYAGISIPTIHGPKPDFSAPTSLTLDPATELVPSKSSKPLEMKGSSLSLDVSSGPGGLNQSKPMNKAAPVLPKAYFPITKLPCSNQGKGGLLYPNSPVNFKANKRGWGANEKLKERSTANANGSSDFYSLNEQNCGPRINNVKGSLVSGVDPAVKSNGNFDSSSSTLIRRDQYNLYDFPTKYDHALFFIIKSYSEDNIHKSIKYNVWASTPNGNKRLDIAFEEAQERVEMKGTKCPVFLFFSVNASGQFCGVAEMVGQVDFSKNMDFWQQDKWNGFFPVKWHIIKDVPNPQFRHIILENNENKPVTNSRDTQEVRFTQGIEMLNIFKNYSLRTSILDDFAFYESRQKAMQDKRTRPLIPRLDHLQKKLDEVAQITSSIEAIDLTATKKSEEEVMVTEKGME